MNAVVLAKIGNGSKIRKFRGCECHMQDPLKVKKQCTVHSDSM